MLDNGQPVPCTKPRGKKRSKHSYEDRAPKIACGVGPLQVLELATSGDEEEGREKGRERKAKHRNCKAEKVDRKQQRQGEQDETKRQVRQPAVEPKVNFGRAWVCGCLGGRTRELVGRQGEGVQPRACCQCIRRVRMSLLVRSKPVAKHAQDEGNFSRSREHPLLNAANGARKQTRACFVQCQSTMQASKAAVKQT